MKRDLAMAVDPSLYPEIEGSTDSECSSSSRSLSAWEKEPRAAVAARGWAHRETSDGAMVSRRDPDDGRNYRRRHHVGVPLLQRGQIPVSFHSADIATLRAQYPDNPLLHDLSDDTRLVVSEPLGDLRGAWQEVPESTCVVVHGAGQDLFAFSPSAA